MSRPRLIIYAVVLALGLLVGLSVVALGPRPSVATGVGSRPLPHLPPPRPRPDGVVFYATQQEPAATPDLLPSGIPAVFAFYNLSELTTGRIMRVGWYRGGRRQRAIAPEDIRPHQGVPGRGMIVLRADGGKMAVGVYELELQTEKRRYRASFVVAANAASILSQQAPAEAQLAISQQVTAVGVAADGRPMRPVARFGGRERVYFLFQFTGAEPGMAVSVRWRGGQTEIRQARRDVVLTSRMGWAHAWLQAESGLPAGAYNATAAIAGDQEALARASFTVQ